MNYEFKSKRNFDSNVESYVQKHKQKFC